MIKLSRLADYAVVVLSVFPQEKGALVSASDLSERSRLPEPTVAKVLKLLASADILTSVRGAGGGYKLARPLAEIDIAGVIEAVDGPVALTACVDGHDEKCMYDATCPMKGRWNGVNTAVLAALQNVSLAEMIGNR